MPNPLITYTLPAKELTKLRVALRTWGVRQRTLHVATVRKNTEKAFQISQQLVPVDEGELKASGHTEYSEKGMSGKIEYDAGHSAMVEYGTGRRGASSTHPKLVSGYRHGPTAGMAAQPYIFPAVEAVRNDFVKDLKNNMKK